MSFAFPLGFSLLSPSAIKRLEAYVRRHPEKATEQLSSIDGKYGGLCHFWPAVHVITPEIARLKRLFAIEVQPFFSYVRPQTNLAPHCDGLVGGRLTSIIQPIFPREQYAPLNFWHPDLSLAHSFEFDDHPLVVDLQELHSVYNIFDSPRLNFQLTIDRPFAEVQDLHSSGKLLRSAPPDF